MPGQFNLVFLLMLTGLILGPVAASSQIIQLDDLPGVDEQFVPAPGGRPETDTAPERDTLIPFLEDTPSANPNSSTRGRTTELEPETETEGFDQAAASTIVPIRPVRPSPSSDDVFRLQGEYASSDFVLYTPVSVSDEQTFTLSYLTGINTLPERSEIRVVLNGIVIGTFQPDSFNDYESVEMSVPAGALQQGVNLVTITVRHTHRVFCGVEASFQLWSDINLRRSGIRLPGSAFEENPASFLAGISAQVAAGDSVPVRSETDEFDLDAFAPFVASLRNYIGGEAPAFISSEFWDVADATADNARVTVLDGTETPVAPQFVKGGDGAITLVVDSQEDFSTLGDRLFADFSNFQNLVNRAELLIPGEETRLSELGQSRLQGYGRYTSLDVPFILPFDWTLLANQKAELVLYYRFSDRLPEGAILQVRVNDSTIRLLPLDSGGGRTLPGLPISFPSRLLSAGANKLEFEALIPGDPEDAACPTFTGPALEIYEGSTIFVPSSPSMSVYDISFALNQLTETGISVTTTAERAFTDSILLQMRAAFANSSFSRAFERSSLTIATVSELNEITSGYSRAEIRALDALLLPREDSDNNILNAGEPVDPWENFSQRTNDPVAIFDLSEWGEFFQRLPSAIANQTLLGEESLVDWLDAREADAVLLQRSSGDPEDLWLFLSPDASVRQVTRSLSLNLNSFDGPSGHVSIFTPEGVWESWETPSPILRLNEPLDLGNVTAVIGNYATILPRFFVGTLLFLTIVSAGVAYLLLLLMRRARS